MPGADTNTENCIVGTFVKEKYSQGLLTGPRENLFVLNGKSEINKQSTVRLESYLSRSDDKSRKISSNV